MGAVRLRTPGRHPPSVLRCVLSCPCGDKRILGRSGGGMLNVLITIDTEVWPLTPDWRRGGLRRDVDRDMYGRTDRGESGLLYQLEVLKRHGLKAVFFLEPLFAEAAGMDVLRVVV